MEDPDGSYSYDFAWGFDNDHDLAPFYKALVFTWIWAQDFARHVLYVSRFLLGMLNMFPVVGSVCLVLLFVVTGFLWKSIPYRIVKWAVCSLLKTARSLCGFATSMVYRLTPFTYAPSIGYRKFGNHMVGKAIGDKEWYYVLVERLNHDHTPRYRFATVQKDGLEQRIPCPGCNESVLDAAIVDAYKHSISRPEFIGHIAFCDPVTKVHVGCGTFFNLCGFLVTSRHTFQQTEGDACILAVHPQHAVIYKNAEAGNNRRAIDFSKLESFTLGHCGATQFGWSNMGTDLIAFKMPNGVLSSLSIKEAKLTDLDWGSEGLVTVYGNPNMTTDKSTGPLCNDEVLMSSRGLISHKCSTVSGFSGSPICQLVRGKYKIVGMHTIGDFMSDGRNHGASVPNILQLAKKIGLIGCALPRKTTLNESKYEKSKQSVPRYFDQAEEWYRNHAYDLADQSIYGNEGGDDDDETQEEKQQREQDEDDALHDRIYGGDVEWNPDERDWNDSVTIPRADWRNSLGLNRIASFIETCSTISDELITDYAFGTAEAIFDYLAYGIFETESAIIVTRTELPLDSEPEASEPPSEPAVPEVPLPTTYVLPFTPVCPSAESKKLDLVLEQVAEQARQSQERIAQLELMLMQAVRPQPVAESAHIATINALPGLLAALTQQSLDVSSRLAAIEQPKLIAQLNVPPPAPDSVRALTSSESTTVSDTRRSSIATSLPPPIPKPTVTAKAKKGKKKEEKAAPLVPPLAAVQHLLHPVGHNPKLTATTLAKPPAGTPAQTARESVGASSTADFLKSHLAKTAEKRGELKTLLETTPEISASESRTFFRNGQASASLFDAGLCFNESASISRLNSGPPSKAPGIPPSSTSLATVSKPGPVFRPHVYLLRDLLWILELYDNAGICVPMLLITLLNRAEQNGHGVAADPRTPGEYEHLFSEAICAEAERVADVHLHAALRAGTLPPRRVRVAHLWIAYVEAVAIRDLVPGAKQDWLDYAHWFDPGVAMANSPTHYNYVVFPTSYNQSPTLTSLQRATGVLSSSFDNGAPFISRFEDPQGTVSSGGVPKFYVDNFMSEDVETRAPRSFSDLGGVGKSADIRCDQMFLDCFDDPIHMLQFTGYDPDQLLTHCFHELREYKDAAEIKIAEDRPLMRDSTGTPTFVRVASCGAPTVPGTNKPTPMSQQALDVLRGLGKDFSDPDHVSRFVLPPSSVEGCEESLRAQSLEMDLDSNMDDVVTPEQMEILASAYAEYPPTDARFISPPKRGETHYNKMDRLFTDIYNSFDGLKSSGFSALYKKGTKKEYLNTEASRGFLSKVVMQTLILRLIYAPFLGCMSPIEMVVAGLKDPSIIFSKKEAHSRSKATKRTWRQIWCCSLRDAVCTLIMHYMQNKADISAYSLGGLHSQAIGLGHHDLGIERFGKTLDYLVDKSPDGRLFDRDATGWDLSVCRDAIMIDAERRAYCARDSLRNPNRLILLFRLLVIHALITSAHVACLGKWLWECLKAGITDSGGPSTSAQNSPIRQIQAMLAGAAAACSLGDDLITAGDVLEYLLKKWGVKTKVLANGEGSNPASGPHDYTSHRWRKTNGTWAAEFLNLDKLIAHADLRTTPTSDGIRMLSDDARAGMMFCLRHSPDQLEFFERFCRGMNWWKEGTIPLDTGFFFE